MPALVVRSTPYTLLLLVAVSGLRGAEPPITKQPGTTPPWQRLLSGADAARAGDLEARIAALCARADFAAAVSPATDMWKLRQRLQGDDHWQTLDAFWLMRTCAAMARKSADQRQSIGRAQALADRAAALVAQGRYREAQPLRERVLHAHRGVLGDEYPCMAQHYNGVAFCQQGQGRHAEAEPNFAKALAIARKFLGEDHPLTAQAYNNLACCWMYQGKLAQAEPGLARVLAIRRRLQGEDHADTALAYNNLAGCQMQQGRFAPAERGLANALTIWRTRVGEDHPLTARAYNNLAGCQLAQGRVAEAEQGFTRALGIYSRRSGEDSADVARAYENLAGCRQEQGRYAEAEQYFAKALVIYRRRSGEDHPDTADGYSGLAVSRQQQGRYAEAEQAFAKALAIRRKCLGEDHPATAAAYVRLGGCHLDQGRSAEAEAAFRKALAAYRKTKGDNHPDIGDAYNAIGLAEYRQRRYAEAEENFPKALAILAKRPNARQADAAAVYNNLAACQLDHGRYTEAEQGFTLALDLLRGRLGDRHPEVAKAHNNLGICQMYQGRYADAEVSFGQALDILRKALGDNHPSTARAYKGLAGCRLYQGRYAEAEALQRRAAAGFEVARLRAAPAGLGSTAFAAQETPLPTLAALLARNGKPAEAWQRFEQSLARGTGDELAARLRRSPADQQGLTELLARLDHLDKQLAGVSGPGPTPAEVKRREELLTLQGKTLDDLMRLRERLDEKYGVSAWKPARLEKIQANLPADAALVAWIDIQGYPNPPDPRREHWGVVVRAKGPPAWVRLPGSGPKRAWTAADDSLPDRLWQSVQTPSGQRSDWQKLSRLLREQRLAPLARHLAATLGLPATRRLIVLPSTSMDGIPLDLLAPNYAVSCAPSGTLLAYLHGQPKPTGRGLLAVADPVFKRPDAPERPLPPGGLLLTLVPPRSNAAAAGLHPGDVLLRYASESLSRPADLPRLIQAHVNDEAIPVEVWRDGHTLPARRVRPGSLGVLVAGEPAPVALAEQRRFDRRLASRGRDGGSDWPPLPGTRVEAEGLRELFGASHEPVTLLAGADASEAKLAELTRTGELSKLRYLHFATHGTFDPRFPLQSAVILAQTQQVPAEPTPTGQVLDGELTAAEVLASWHLNADLVVLSACQTGLGKYERGEGFLGFAQAVLLTGGRSVCLSLWKVDDTATALLMQRFYANLLGQRAGLKGPMPKAEALAEAKAWLRELKRDEALALAAALTGGVSRGKRPGRPQLPGLPRSSVRQDDRPYAHPYYWAAFALVGNDQ